MKALDVNAKPSAVISMDDTQGSIGEVSRLMAESSERMNGHGEAIQNGMNMMAQAVAMLSEAMSRPKQIVRGKDGRAIGVQ